jgi:hypothetical protein
MKFCRIASWCQFRQHFTSGFFIFLYLDLRFVIFVRKNIVAKAARNELVKLTPDQTLFRQFRVKRGRKKMKIFITFTSRLFCQLQKHTHIVVVWKKCNFFIAIFCLLRSWHLHFFQDDTNNNKKSSDTRLM